MSLQQIEDLEFSLALDIVRGDFGYFLRQWVMTQDEHDKTSPIKPMPDKQYIRELAHLFQTTDKLLVEKSRQMMVSWVACAYALWLALFHDGRRVFIQSKKEQDANALLDRVKLIYNHLPERLKTIYPCDPPAYCKMAWGKRNSIIQAVPQGADVLRQYTASAIISDEAAFQEKAEEAYIASRPTLVGGGQMIMISSPNFKNFFYLLKSDLI